MKKNNSNFLMRKVLILSAIFFLMGQYACKKDGKLSPDFDSGGLSVSFVDTFSVKTNLELDDSLRTDFSLYNMLGLYNDPIFGPVSSSIYTQVLLSGINVDFGTAQIDSIVLTMDYQELYGDSNTPMSINVYELNESLNSSTEYFSNTYTAHNPTPIASKAFTPKVLESVFIHHDSVTADPHLRIKLPNSLGQSILDGSPYADNSTFFNVLNGLYITTQDSAGNSTLPASGGSIISFDLNSSLSTITLYYHNNQLGQSNQVNISPLKYNFSINTSGVKYSRFAHNYTGTDIEAHLNNLPTKDTSLSYVSTMAGVKTKVEIPNIKDLANEGPVIINKAELEITIESGTEGSFDIPLESISLIGIDASGNDVFLPDFFEGLDYYGGTYDAATGTYSFNIARHINDLVYNTGNYGMYIVANGGTTTANRAVFGSENNSTAKIKLNITYSKI